MTGFSVAFSRSGAPATIASANRMRQSLKVFGADRDAAMTDGPFALSWTFAAGYTPQDRFERQPVRAEDRWHMVFAGLLDHREELAEKLAISSSDLARTPDVMLAMRAWQKWGSECWRHLYGGISFVVCDNQQHRLIAFRSSERGPHIYYHVSGDQLILTTSTKAIFCFPEIAREVDETKIADALVLNYQDSSRSYFKNVHILPQGHFLEASASAIKITDFDPLDNVAPIRFPRDEDYVEAARELLGKSVSSAMRADGSVAIGLSGGLDSSAVAVTMIEQMRASAGKAPTSLKAYVSVPEAGWDGRVRKGFSGDESGPVRALMKLYPELDVEFVGSENVAFDHGLDRTHSYADMPLRGAGNHYWGQDIHERCRRDGHRVLMTGASGNGTYSFAAADTLFAQWFRRGQWVHMLQEYRRYSKRRGTSWHAGLFPTAVLPNLPNWLFDYYVRARAAGKRTGFSSYSAIHPDFANDMEVTKRMSDLGMNDRFRKPPSRKALMRIMLQRGARNESGGFFEASKAMTGVQVRDPLGDRKLIEFCYAIPDDQFLKDGIDRRLIKRVMADKLPPEIWGAPRGEQAADWHGRKKRELARIVGELDRLADNPEMAARLDIERMRRVIREWPVQTPVSTAEYPDYAIARYAIGRALSIARFINQVEGRN